MEFDLSYIATVGGAAAVTMLIVQLIKPPNINAWVIRCIVYLIGTALLTISYICTNPPISFDKVFLCLINGVVVAASAIGIYQITRAEAIVQNKNEPPLTDEKF